MLLLVKNDDETSAPAMPMITTSSARPASQRRAEPSEAPIQARGRSGMAGPPQPQRGGQPDRDEPVEGDGQQEQETPDRLVPERRDAEHVERGADRVEQQ